MNLQTKLESILLENPLNTVMDLVLGFRNIMRNFVTWYFFDYGSPTSSSVIKSFRLRLGYLVNR